MGSFNTACFATRQTITPGDEVVLIPISQNTSGKPINIFQSDGKKLQVFGCFDTTCYPTAFWDYYGLFLTGVYDDYGRFEINREPENIKRLKSLLISLKTDLFQTELGENEYHDLAVRTPDVSEDTIEDKVISEWEELHNGIFQGRAFIKKFFGQPAQFSLAVILKVTYDELIKMMKNQKLYSGAKCSVEGLAIETFQSQNRCMGSFKGLEDPVSELVNFFARSIKSAPRRIIGGISCFGLEDLDESPISDEQLHELITAYHEFINSNEENVQIMVPIIKKIIGWQLENFIAHMALSELEIRIEPTYYVGQDYDNSIGKKFKKLVSAVSNAHSKALKERYESF